MPHHFAHRADLVFPPAPEPHGPGGCTLYPHLRLGTCGCQHAFAELSSPTRRAICWAFASRTEGGAVLINKVPVPFSLEPQSGEWNQVFIGPRRGGKSLSASLFLRQLEDLLEWVLPPYAKRRCVKADRQLH